MTSDIVAFIQARLGEDERAAQAATSGPWRHNPNKQWLAEPDDTKRALLALLGARGEEYVAAGPLRDPTCVATTGPADDPQSMADAAFVARHDPARVMRDVEGKRRLLDFLVDLESRELGGEWRHLDQKHPAPIQLLALPYADHPDYQESWRP